METTNLSLIFLERLTAIVMSLVASVGMRVHEGRMAPGIGEGVVRRLQRARSLVDDLIRRLVAGTLRDWVRGRPARAGRRAETRAKLAAGTRWWASMPRRQGWLCPLAPCTERYRDSAAQYGIYLAQLLAEPEVQRLLALVPGIGRALAPVCRMLNVDPALCAPKAVAVAAPPNEFAPDVVDVPQGTGVIPISFQKSSL